MRNLSANLHKSLRPGLASNLTLFFLLCGFSFNAIADSVGCNDTFVSLNDEALVINVTPNGTDDTVNIQCALDAAVADGVPIVALSAGTFFISNLLIEDFKGTLEGKAKIATTIEVLDNSIDCVGMQNAGQASSVIKFVNGEPRIRFLTLRADDSCIGSGRPSNFLHFTGESTDVANCDNDVIFGAVDRVILDGTSAASGPFVGISAWPEGDNLGGCKNTLLGTFKLNRSELFNTLFGVMTTMKGGAQVDINFNEFHDHQIAVYLLNTNQNTTITTNKFFSTSTIQGFYNGVSIATLSASAPTTTRAVVHNNEFNVSSSAGGPSIGVTGLQDGRVANISSVVTNNKFNLGGVETFGVFFGDISNTHVSANRFTGGGNGAIFVSGTTDVTGWTITANTGLGPFTSAIGGDIALGSTTSECIIGPGQGATIINQGSDNSILAIVDSSPTYSKVPLKKTKNPGFNEMLIRAEISKQFIPTSDLGSSR